MRQRRGGYRGTADVLLDAENLGTFTVDLTGCVDIRQVRPVNGGVRSVEGLASWDGRLAGMSAGRLFTIAGTTVTIRTPDGLTGQALVVDSNGRAQGSGDPPFALN